MEEGGAQSRAQAQAQTPQQPPQGAYPNVITPSKVVSSKQWYNTKIVLGALSLTASVIILGLGGGLVSNYADGPSTWWALVFGYCPAVAAGLWEIADFITLCVRRDRSIHPGAHVAINLILWLGCLVCVIFLTAGVVFDSQCDYYCQLYPVGDFTYGSPGYSTYLGLEGGVTAFVYILLIIHFTLFVRACVECHRRNKMPAAFFTFPGTPGVYYVPVPMESMPKGAAEAFAASQQQQQPQGSQGGLHGFYAPSAPQMSYDPAAGTRAEVGGPLPVIVEASSPVRGGAAHSAV